MTAANTSPPRVAPWRDPRTRGIALQVLLVLALVLVVGAAGRNALDNMRARNIPTGFGFLHDVAGFDINLALIPFRAGQSTFIDAFVVGLLNTLVACVIALVFSTIIGFLVGIARLSSSWPVAKLATVYVETIRNVPLVLQLLFWYNAVLTPLPNPRQAISFLGLAFLHNRGLVLPEPVFGPGSIWILVALAAGIVAAVVYARRARRLQDATGKRSPVALVSAGFVILLPLAVYFALAEPVRLAAPQLRGFNFVGGLRVLPELVALVTGLTLYTAAFISEVVRAGVTAVPRGQVEAAQALGLPRRDVMGQVVLPQAMRVIVPPLTNQYLNLVKNSSLAVFVGYPDLVQVFGDKVREQSSASVQVVAITMTVYLAISLVTSGVMTLYDRRVAIVER